MNRVTGFLCGIVLLFLASESFAATVVVNIQNFLFTPSNVTVNIGDVVKWVNKDNFTHTTTSTAPSGLWDATLAPNATFSRVFNKEGTYAYHCKIHPSMTGGITVRTPEQTRIHTGKAIIDNQTIPITLKLTGKSPALVYLGSYIVNTEAGCANCHSCPTYAAGHNPFKGEPKQFNGPRYLAGGVPFGGGLVSENITPDAAGRPAGLTRAAFKNLMVTGHDPDVPGAIIQVMPWPILGMMSSHDLDAIYEYLRAIPSRSKPSGGCTGFGQ